MYEQVHGHTHLCSSLLCTIVKRLCLTVFMTWVAYGTGYQVNLLNLIYTHPGSIVWHQFAVITKHLTQTLWWPTGGWLGSIVVTQRSCTVCSVFGVVVRSHLMEQS